MNILGVSPVALIYIVVPVPRNDFSVLYRLRVAVGRPWLEAYQEKVGYWVPTIEDAENERAVLALAGFASEIEYLDPLA